MLFCGKTLSFFQFFGSKVEHFVTSEVINQGRDPPGPSQSSFQSIWINFESFLTFSKPNFMLFWEKTLSFFQFFGSKSEQFVTSKVFNQGRDPPGTLRGPPGPVSSSFWSTFWPQKGQKRTRFYLTLTFLVNFHDFKSLRKWHFCLKSRSDPSIRVDWLFRSTHVNFGTIWFNRRPLRALVDFQVNLNLSSQILVKIFIFNSLINNHSESDYFRFFDRFVHSHRLKSIKRVNINFHVRFGTILTKIDNFQTWRKPSRQPTNLFRNIFCLRDPLLWGLKIPSQHL